MRQGRKARGNRLPHRGIPTTQIYTHVGDVVLRTATRGADLFGRLNPSGVLS
ncbi:hypothetical protein [Methylobacterium sp. D54C]